MLCMPDRVERIATLIVDRPTCLPCIATKADLSLPLVRAYLERISKSVMVHQAPRERCAMCGVVGPVISIGRN